MTIEVRVAAAKKLLGTDIKPAIEAGARGVAAAIQKVLEPYPAARPRIAGKPYYIRGKGSFSAKGKLIKASEKLNQKWSIRKVAWGGRLRNRASYAVYVHGRKGKQNRYHGKHGWVRQDEAVRKVKASGQIPEIMKAAIGAALKENAK